MRRRGFRSYRMWLHEKRLKAALRKAERPDDDIEGALVRLIDDFITRWIGLKK